MYSRKGPNAPVGHGSLMAGLGWTSDYICQWLRKIAAEDIEYVVPKQEAVDEFNAYADEIMQTLVWSGGCQSWYKNHRVDGKVTAVWAGSVIGYKEMIDQIRAEDFDIRYRTKNRFRFMGNGRTKREYVHLHHLRAALLIDPELTYVIGTTRMLIWLFTYTSSGDGSTPALALTDADARARLTSFA